MTRASALTPESPYAPGGEFGPEVDTWAASRLPVEHDPRWYGIGEAKFAEQARAVGFINGEDRYAVAYGAPGFVPEPVEPVTDEDMERVELFIAAATDMRYALLLRRGQ